MGKLPEIRASAVHPHAWLWESLESQPSFMLRAMFGAKAVYLAGKLQLCFTPKEEPWCGVLVCTERAHHAALIAEVPSLRPHPILPKWLYLPESSNDFEFAASHIVQLVRHSDDRIGVVPKSRTPKRKTGTHSARRRRTGTRGKPGSNAGR